MQTHARFLQKFRNLCISIKEMDGQQQFGTRFLTDPRKVFEHNSWDDVEWDDEYKAEALEKVAKNSQDIVQPNISEQLDLQSSNHWNTFYDMHQNKFFKDRQWLFKEFPELLHSTKDTVAAKCVDDKSTGDVSDSLREVEKSSLASPIVKSSGDNTTVDSKSQQSFQANLESEFSQSCAVSKITDINNSTCAKKDDANVANTGLEGSTLPSFPGELAKYRIFEVGCGVGNTVFPVLQTNNDPDVFVYCCDLSSTAIDILQQHHLYEENRCQAFVGDVTNFEESLPFPENSLDVITLIFILSAVSPEKMQATLSRLARFLKPGGILLFRDYGRYDLCQLRFKNGQCLSDNFYARQDGTRVYFFTQEEMRDMLTEAGLIEVQNIQDRRLQVNRARQTKMYRMWIQCKYRKPAAEPVSSTQCEL